MNGDTLKFGDLMADAHRVILALDAVTPRDGSRSAVIIDARRLYALLLEYLGTTLLSPSEANAVQNALDVIHARMKFFGESPRLH